MSVVVQRSVFSPAQKKVGVAYGDTHMAALCIPVAKEATRYVKRVYLGAVLKFWSHMRMHRHVAVKLEQTKKEKRKAEKRDPCLKILQKKIRQTQGAYLVVLHLHVRKENR